MDNRDLVNQELKNNFDGGILSLAPNAPDNHVELPKSEENQVSESGSTINNYNMSVNINSASGGSRTADNVKANNIIQNVLNVDRPSSPEDLKKNLNIDSSKSGNDTFKMNFSDGELEPLNIRNDFMNSGPSAPSAEIRDIQFFTAGEATDYGYSSAKIKTENIELNRTYNTTHQYTDQAIRNNAILSTTPNSVFNNDFNENYENTNINLFEQSNLKVDTTKNNGHEEVSKMSEELQRKTQVREKERDDALTTMALNQRKRGGDEQDIMDIQSVNEPPQMQMLSGADTLSNSGVRSFNNMTGRSSTIGTFIEKMNSPPIWRTVLG